MMKKLHPKYSFLIYLLVSNSSVLLLLTIQIILTNELGFGVDFDRSAYKWWHFLFLFSPGGLSLTIPYALLIGGISKIMRAPLQSSFLATPIAFLVGAFVTQVTLTQSFARACEREDCYLNDLGAQLIGLMVAAVAGLVVIVVWSIINHARRTDIHSH